VEETCQVHEKESSGKDVGIRSISTGSAWTSCLLERLSASTQVVASANAYDPS
jgi:hypothetical protein